MKKQLSLLFAIMLLAVACKTSSSSKYEARISSPSGEVPSVDEFVQDALYNGLMRDQFPKDILTKLMSADVFVPKCPICRPTEGGMRDYLNEDGTPKATDKLPPALLANLQSDNKETQHQALRDLVARYSAWQREALQLDEAGKKELDGKLAAARKRGMDNKSQNFGKFCPSCDGACEIK